MKNDDLDIAYLSIIQNENDIIEEGKLLNYLLAGALGYSASFLPLKIDAKTSGKSEELEMATTEDDVVKQNTNEIVVDGQKYKKINLSLEELYIAKFIWSQVKDHVDECPIPKLKIEVAMIFKTLNTRLQKYREADNFYSLIQKIVEYDCRSYDFDVTDDFTSFIADLAKTYNSGDGEVWKDSTLTFYAQKAWQPTKEMKNTVDMTARYQTEHFYIWSVKTKDNAAQNLDVDKLTDQEKFLARVIYSETSTLCSPQEVKLVCKVIMNRVKNPAFGRKINGRMVTPQNAYQVVSMKGAFSCVNSTGNSNWSAFTPKLNKSTVRDSVYAHFMMNGDQTTIALPSEYNNIVYYHDKSISCPAGWTTKTWKPELVLETDHFKFYKIVPNKKSAT